MANLLSQSPAPAPPSHIIRLKFIENEVDRLEVTLNENTRKLLEELQTLDQNTEIYYKKFISYSYITKQHRRYIFNSVIDIITDITNELNDDPDLISSSSLSSPSLSLLSSLVKENIINQLTYISNVLNIYKEYLFEHNSLENIINLLDIIYNEIVEGKGYHKLYDKYKYILKKLADKLRLFSLVSEIKIALPTSATLLDGAYVIKIRNIGSSIISIIPHGLKKMLIELRMYDQDTDEYRVKNLDYNDNMTRYRRYVLNNLMGIITDVIEEMNNDSTLVSSSSLSSLRQLFINELLQVNKQLNQYKKDISPHNLLRNSINIISNIHSKIKINQYQSYAKYVPIFVMLEHKLMEFYLGSEGIEYFDISSSSSNSNNNKMNFYDEENIYF